MDAAVAAAVAAVRNVAAANPVVLVDGRSGAGKTTFARELAARWPQRGRVQLVALDDIYPGWDGLSAGVDYARTALLLPHARGVVGVWQRWDWAAAERAEAHAVDPSLPLIIEGSGILTAQTASLGDVRVWLDAPVASRRSRALQRDGEAYRPYWDMWAEQEDRHVAVDEPLTRATLTLMLP